MLMRWRLPILGALVLAILASALYLPFLQNALVFDDHNLFTNLSVYDFAQTPFDFHPRTFPYFTLGLIQVLNGTIEAQRIASLILHILCAWALFVLLSALLRQTLRAKQGATNDETKQISTQTTVLAFIGATWFAIHPVAVYGAGYLAQRTILFATLFSLLSLWFYRRAFAENRTTDVITAALFYSLAVFSKEHAVMLPLAALTLTFLYDGECRSKARRAGLYLLLCVPAALTAVLAAKSVVGTSYEPYVIDVAWQMREIALLEKSWGSWVVSGALQTSAFFDYIYYWLFPDVRSISADMRLDFVKLWQSKRLILTSLLFLAGPAVALFFLRKGGRFALFGCGFFYSWLMFMTELSTIRFQEPLVLYRSYLWAPGFAIMLVAVLCRFAWRSAAAVSVVVMPLLFVLAQDRLESLVSERTVWNDAAAKLASADLPGADRIYYNRSGERFKLGQLDASMEDANRVVMLNPNAMHGYLGRGMIHLKRDDYGRALTELNLALAVKPGFGFALYRRGLALEGLGRRDDAMVDYAAAAKSGDMLAKWRLEYLTSSSR